MPLSAHLWMCGRQASSLHLSELDDAQLLAALGDARIHRRGLEIRSEMALKRRDRALHRSLAADIAETDGHIRTLHAEVLSRPTLASLAVV